MSSLRWWLHIVVWPRDSVPSRPFTGSRAHWMVSPSSVRAPGLSPTPHPTEVSEVEALALIRHLTIPGANARWASRLAPIMAAGAGPNTCSPSAWAHVKMGRRATLSDGYAAVLRERVAASAPPVKMGGLCLSTVHL
jgi:hypothetical protein